MISIQNLQKKFGHLSVIEDFNLSIEKGKIYCVFGPSGCGKTTLINILSGVLPFDGGSIKGIRDYKCSYIFQEERLLPWYNLEENIKFVLDKTKIDKNNMNLCEEYLKLVELESFKESYPEELSGGMKRRASIARALAYRGQVLIMDEPFKGLHLEVKHKLMDYIIKYFNTFFSYCIFVTHDIDEALYLSNEIITVRGLPLTIVDRIVIDTPLGSKRNGDKKLIAYKEQILNTNCSR